MYECMYVCMHACIRRPSPGVERVRPEQRINKLTHISHQSQSPNNPVAKATDHQPTSRKHTPHKPRATGHKPPTYKASNQQANTHKPPIAITKQSSHQPVKPQLRSATTSFRCQPQPISHRSPVSHMKPPGCQLGPTAQQSQQASGTANRSNSPHATSHRSPVSR